MMVGSLFAGIGGFDLAAERCGMDVVWQSELDPHASRVLAHHWPDVPNHGDIHDLTGPATVDVLTGGFPCQDYSVAGKGAGLAGDRGALWWQFHRLIADLRPSWIVGENVHGLTTSRHQDSLRTIIGSLVDLGYGVVWRVLDAQWFGVAQRRRRVFIVGHSGGVPRPEVLALAQGVCGDSPPSRETGQGVAPTLEAGANGTGGTRPPGTTVDTAETLQVVSALTSKGTQGGGPDDNMAQADHLIVNTLQAPENGPRYDHWTETFVAFAQNQRDEVRDLDDLAGGLQAEPGMKQQTYVLQEVGARESKNQNGVGIGVTEAEVSYTLQAGQQHGIAQPPYMVRRLTPLECERLQGFPDGWTAIPGNSDSQRYKQLGNAVAVPVVEWILGNIAKAAA